MQGVARLVHRWVNVLVRYPRMIEALKEADALAMEALQPSLNLLGAFSQATDGFYSDEEAREAARRDAELSQEEDLPLRVAILGKR